VATLAQQGAIPYGELMSLLTKTLKRPGSDKRLKKIKDLLVTKGIVSSGVSKETLELIAAMIALYLAKKGDAQAEALIDELFGMPSRQIFLPEGGGSHHEEGREDDEHREYREGENLQDQLPKAGE
jgi:hypothetical protein